MSPPGVPAGRLLVAGAGIGGLAAALAASRAGWQVQLLERADGFGDVGAGIQLGPNATRLLQAWGLGDALDAAAAYPDALRVHSAATGSALGVLRLGDAAQARYGAPYATLHRRDLHALLFRAARDAGVQVRLGSRIVGVDPSGQRVAVTCADGHGDAADGLVGADGLWSAVRSAALGPAPAPQPSGHVAYRTLVAQQTLPAALRSRSVRVWLGAHLHAVAYPVRGGDWLNLVVVVGDRRLCDATDWDHGATADDLLRAVGGVEPGLAELLRSAGGWRLWVLADVPPLTGPGGMARGRVALLGDAAHAMPPYLAQGAGMALEDAAELGRQLAGHGAAALSAAWAAYAAARWRRNAWVQARARRNGRVFHATGPVRWARDMVLRVGGERVLDVPALYGGGPGRSEHS